ncbi:hypothetical protein [Sporosarcina sp. NPDC096371]|uniref:hypothetical protein n=1 Tax=Sporosarcina sp. NPDC096371 TaxID=3364530 RepID=UPI00382E5B6A
MRTQLESLIIRKVIATFVATIIPAIPFAFFTIKESIGDAYRLGTDFLGWLLVFFIYIGLVILVYGNMISIGTECVQRKFFPQHDWIYIVVLAIFGLASELLFRVKLLAITGMLIALFYAIIDKWIGRRMSKSKPVKRFVLVPIVLVLVLWGYFQMTSPPMPPFTKEDAVEYAASGGGSDIDHFPKEIGEWEGMIDGYQVIRETNAKNIGNDDYIVTFKEDWSKGTVKGSWSFSYQVNRHGQTATTGDGNRPPYYERN